MSSPLGSLSERTTTAVLLALWNRPETTIHQLLRETLAPLPDLQFSLQLLRDRGCHIEQTPTSIRLAATGLPCWQDVLQYISRQLNLVIARRVMIFHRTASTDDIAWQAAANPDNHGLLVIADEQSAGRGRMGHSWSAKPRQSILLSLLLRDLPADSLDRLTLLAGLAAAQAIEHALHAAAALPFSVQIKWPNDLLVDGRKLAGILVERKGPHAVIGIGINVAQTTADFPPELAPRATSIYQAAGAMIDRLRIVAALLLQLDQLPRHPETSDWLDQWKARCSMLNTTITADCNGQTVTGRVIDIDPLHGLIVHNADGTHFLSAQTTTLRPE